MSIYYHPPSDTYFSSNEVWVDDCQPRAISEIPAGVTIPAGMGLSTVMPSMDFETFSAVGYDIDPMTGKVKGKGGQGKGGLPVVGTPVYAEHESTEVLCLYYDLKDGRGVRGWTPGTPEPTDLIEHIRAGKPIEAWNVTFEFWIWNMICVRRLGWPVLRLDQCYCAMAKSRRHSLPGALGGCAKVLGTTNKDPEGNRLLNKLSRPVSATKNRKAPRWTQSTAWDDYLKLYAYCGQDVAAEDAAAALIPDLTDYERKTWLTDQNINARGVLVEVESLEACLRIMREMIKQYTLEICTLTGGAVGGATEVAKLTDWLRTQRVYMPDMTADSVKEALGGAFGTFPDTAAHRALEIRSILAGANIKKLPALKLQINSDGRLRNQYMYCGADRTGRWSAGGVQLQNITSKGPKSAMCESCEKYFNPIGEGCPRCGSQMWHKLNDWTVDAVEQALEDIKHGQLADIELIWGDPSTVLAGCLRGLFIAKEGTRFICCDFSAIEAVAAACLARCQWRIDVFNTHGKIYEMSASKITGTPLDVYFQYKKDNGFDHPDRKKIGKIAELASGYGGWVGAWKNFGADMSDDEIKQQVLAWRDASPEIVEMWGGQFKHCGPGKWDYRPELFGLEGMAILAILNPGKCYHYIDISYAVFKDVLYCRLPSGRFLTYHRPKLIMTEDKLGRDHETQYYDGQPHKVRICDCWSITFEGHNSNAQKGPVGWHVLETYGGRLFENVVQAVSADIQAEALVRLEENYYPVVMHTHDEAIGEVPYVWDEMDGYDMTGTPRGSIDEMAAIMTERPHWASWWPLRAAGWEHSRYQKD
jgi:DNA polymerase